MRQLLLIAILLLSGCNLFSDNPLSDPNHEPIDASLIGTWGWNDVNDWGFVHIGTDAAGKGLVITMVEYKKDGKMETTEFKGHATKLSSHRFLNLKWTTPPEADKGYFFVEYKVNGDILECAFLDDKPIQKSISAGALKGEVLSPDGLMPTVLIHASQNELRQYILQNAKSLIRDTFKFRKIKPAGP